MKLNQCKTMKKIALALIATLALVAGSGAVRAQGPTPTPVPLHAVVTLTGGPNPNPAVVGNTIRCRWSAHVEGEPAVRSECLTQKASYAWTMESLTWLPPGGTTQSQPTSLVTLTANGPNATTTWVGDKAGIWTLTVRCTISYTGTECGGPWSGSATGNTSISVQDFVLHPSRFDFNDLQNGAARVLMIKTRSDAYYSINNTTRANRTPKRKVVR